MTTSSSLPEKAEDKLALGLEQASQVSLRVEIEDVSLVESVIRQRLIQKRLPPNIWFGTGTKTEVQKLDSGKQPSWRIVVLIRFELVGKYPDMEPGEERIRIEASFRLTYRLDSIEGLDEENFRAFGELNGIYNAYPYWREYLQSTITRMGLPPLIAPLFKPKAEVAARSASAKNG